jgi:hypothetical protein
LKPHHGSADAKPNHVHSADRLGGLNLLAVDEDPAGRSAIEEVEPAPVHKDLGDRTAARTRRLDLAVGTLPHLHAVREEGMAPRDLQRGVQPGDFDLESAS